MNDHPNENLPRHVAIIMDGNGRWAEARGLKRLEGHQAGVDSVRAITRFSRDRGIKYLTLYSFSKENWQRPKFEVEGLMRLLNRYLKRELDELLGNGIRLNALGDLNRLPKATGNLLRETIARTSENRGMVLTLALSYSGRQEIIEACRALSRDCLEGRLRPEEIDEAVFNSRLQTGNMPDPDLLIRTGGEQRVSNFLLYQIAYTELYITDIFWPDFREQELETALASYMGRERRFGMTSEQIAGKKR
ncbi:MAG: isoprenyl transferase [Proteobacteria bacterium]|nr:isoprenyl transferase [Pseudomonadota bacterium]